MTSEIEKQFSLVCDLCERENISVENLQNGTYLTEEVEREYTKLIDLAEKHPNTHRLQIQDQLKSNIELDCSRIQKSRIGNLEVVKRKDILSDKYPNLEDKISNNMVKVPSDTALEEIAFKYDSNYLIVSDHLQKNKALIQSLFEIWTGEYDFYIGLNYNKIGEKKSEYAIEEAEHWFGPVEFTDISSTVRTEGLTVYGNDYDSFSHGLKDNMEFLFENRGNEWVIEIEELLPRQSMVRSTRRQSEIYGKKLKFYTRYAHLILNQDLTKCIHLDGAIREYPSIDQFSKRHTDPDKNLQSGHHKRQKFDKYKLFKLDSWSGGRDEFSQILIQFFKYSPHILRFFDEHSERADKLERQRAKLFKTEIEKDRQ